MSIARIIKEEYAGGRDLSGIGGVETGRDAAEFILLGANTVQVGLILSASQPVPWREAFECCIWLCNVVRAGPLRSLSAVNCADAASDIKNSLMA